MSDTISRRQAIEALRRNQEAYLHDNYFDKIVETDIETLTELPSAQPEQQWIPVRERLPDKNRACLITNIYGDVAWNYWIDGEWIVLPDYVVAWMPLPEPYTED